MMMLTLYVHTHMRATHPQAVQQLLSTPPGEAVSPRHVEELCKRILTNRCTLLGNAAHQLQAYLLCCIIEVCMGVWGGDSARM